jgi:polyhydroxyalkanoate synthesis repressor PhaR
MTVPGTILIKKYENRRLYDATNSRYVNLDEVAQFVKLGYEVRVVDAASGDDITRMILTQIIADGAKTPDSTFPLDVLRQMIIASERASQEGAMRYIKAMTDMYQSTVRAMAPALNPFDFMQMHSEQTGENGDQSDEASARPVNRDERNSQQVEQLKQRVADLEKLISSIASEKKAGAGKNAGAEKKSRSKPRAQSSSGHKARSSASHKK